MVLNPPQETLCLQVQGVTKRYATVLAVDAVSFEVQRGEVFALLGPNGAGKTSLVRMLVGITQPDSGDVRSAIQDRLRIGYLPEDRGLYKDVPILRTLEYFGVLHGMPHAEAHHEAKAWLDRLGLADRAKEKLDALSKGNQQKVQFASALLHRPDLAILDEPFSGLDPLNQELFLDVIGELRGAGTTVVLSAHQMSLVERVADHVHLISRGRTVLQGTIPEVLRQAGVGERYTIDLASDLSAEEAAAAGARLTADRQVEVERLDGEPVGPLIRALSMHAEVLSVRSQHPTLHDAYVSAVRAQEAQP